MEDKKIEQFTNNIIMIFPIYHKHLIRTQEKCSLITPYNPQIRILGMLMMRGPMHMSVISQKLCVTKPNITKLINKLIAEKLVEKNYEKKDKRVTNIKLTQKGKQYLIKRKKETQSIIKKNLSVLNKKDFNNLVNASEEMIKVLSKLNKDEDIFKAITKI